MADSEDLVAIILSALESVSGSELCLLSKLVASESSLQLQRLWVLMASPSHSLSIISFLETLSPHHRRLLLARVTLHLVCGITNFLEGMLAACGAGQEALDVCTDLPHHSHQRAGESYTNSLPWGLDMKSADLTHHSHQCADESFANFLPSGLEVKSADLAHHSHQCAGDSYANSLPSEIDMKGAPAVVRGKMGSIIVNPMYVDMTNQQLPFAGLSSVNSSYTGLCMENGRHAGVGSSDARIPDVDFDDPCLAGSDVANPRHACAGPGNINIAGLNIRNSTPRHACAGPGNINIACHNVTNLGPRTKNLSMEPSKMKGRSVDIANSRYASMRTCAGSSNPRFTGMDVCMDVSPASLCEDVKDDVALQWGETDAAFLFLFLWETQEQECQEAMQRWCIDPYIYHMLVVQDMDVLGYAKSKAGLIRAPKWRERLQQYLLQNILQVGYGFPGMMASTTFPASLSAYIDTIGRFQRILKSMSAEESIEQRPPPASAETLHSLPTSVIGLSSEEKGKVCIICKEELEPSTIASQLPCLHVYHWDCILSWLKQRNNCPVCRHELPTDDCDYELQRKIQILKERVS